MYRALQDLGWAMISLPWIGKELEDTQEIMGKNFWPYGIEPNRQALEALFQYSYEQGLAKRKLTVEGTVPYLDVKTDRGIICKTCALPLRQYLMKDEPVYF